MARIFISHSSANNAEAIAVRDWLEENGWDDVFLDLDPHHGLKAGEKWQEALKAAAQKCEAVIFLISPEWADSKWCLAEFLLAKNLNKRLIGVVISETPIDDLPSEMTSEWQLTDLTEEPRSVAFKTKPPKSRKTVTVSYSEVGLDRLRIGLQEAGLDAKYFAWPPESDPDRPPYRGLQALEAEDAGIFFGRDGAVVEALDRMRGLRDGPPPRLMVILGASGAGKSSFMRAGVLPRLERDNRHFLPLPVIRPEHSAITGEAGLIASLAGAFESSGIQKTRAVIRKAVEAGDAAVGTLLGELLHPDEDAAESGKRPPVIVIPVDQAEELYLAEGADEADRLFQLLGHLLEQDEPAVTVLMTIRSDAYEHLQLDHRLEGVRQNTLSLPPLPRGAYMDVITGPARRLEGTDRPLRLDEKLTDALLRDIEDGGGKDALPLLAFTLERLYAEYGGDGDLKLSEYEELGRIRGSIEAAVERALKEADADAAVPKDRQARLALLRRGLIPWLAGIDPDTGAPRRRVARMSEIPEESQALIRHLIEQRLLSTDVEEETGEVTVEPAHEALLRQWGLLEGWLEEDFEALATLEGVKRAARDWEANERDHAWLAHSGGRLEAAEQVRGSANFEDHLEAGERDYLAAARQHENRVAARERRGRRIMVLSLVAGVIGLAAAAVWAFSQAEYQATLLQQSKTALDASEAANREAELRQLQAEAARRDADEARRSVEVQKDEAQRAESLFLADLASSAVEKNDPTTGLLVSLEGLRDAKAETVLQRERRWVPAAERSAYGAFWRNRERVVFGGHRHAVMNAVFSPDGSSVLTTSEQSLDSLISELGRDIDFPESDEVARLWSARTGEEIAALMGHESTVQSAVFSPDGTRILTVSADNTARIWDASTGRQIAALEGHDEIVLKGVFSPDGNRVVTGAWDDTARIWDAKTGKTIAILKGHTDDVENVAFSPDGKMVATASNDSTARLWNAETGEMLFVLNGHELSLVTIEFSADGKHVLTSSLDDTARLWDVATGMQVVEFKGHQDSVRSAVFSPNGTHVLTASEDNTARLWDARTGQSINTLKGHGDNVRIAAFSPDGRLILTASDDGTVRLWNTQDMSEVVILGGHTDKVNRAAFSPDGKAVVTASSDSTARIWDADIGTRTAFVKGYAGDVWNAVFSGDVKQLLTVAWDGEGTLWDIEDVQFVERTRPSGYAEVKFNTFGDASTIFTPDGTRLLTVNESNWLVLLDPRSGRADAIFVGHEKQINSVVLTPDGKRILTASDDKTARLWDAETGRELAVFKGHADTLKKASISPDGTRVLTSSVDNTVRLWDASSGREIAVYKGHEDDEQDAIFSPDGKYVLWVTTDGLSFIEDGSNYLARLVEATSGSVIHVLKGHNGNIPGFGFSPDGSRIVTASDDSSARLWHVQTGETLFVLKGHEDYVRQAVFSPDGTRVVTASDDNTARLWNAETGEVIAVLEGHEDDLSDAAFSPDGSRILTLSRDNTARLWDSATAQEFAVLDRWVEGLSENVAFTSDGLFVVANASYGRSQIWRLFPTTQALVDYAKQTAPRCLTPKQRENFHVSPEPPAWCIEMRKWPYQGDKWRSWLAAKRAGENPLMPIQD